MALYLADIELDGVTYKIHRPPSQGADSNGGRNASVTYTQFTVGNLNHDTIGGFGGGVVPTRAARLDPENFATFHRGCGASRSIGIEGMMGYTRNGWTQDPGMLLPGPFVTTFPLLPVNDSFIRANSSSTLGTADFGGAWTARSGTWGINGSAGYLATNSGADNWATIDAAPVINLFVQADIVCGAAGSAGVSLRFGDTSNSIIAYLTTGGGATGLSLASVIAGVKTVIAQGAATYVVGQIRTLRLTMVGNVASVYLDGTLVVTGTISALTWQTSVGMYATSTAGTDWRWDNFKAGVSDTALQDFAEQDGSIYGVGGVWAVKLEAGAEPLQLSQDFGPGNAIAIKRFKSSLFVGFSTPTAMWELPSGQSWTNAVDPAPILTMGQTGQIVAPPAGGVSQTALTGAGAWGILVQAGVDAVVSSISCYVTAITAGAPVLSVAVYDTDGVIGLSGVGNPKSRLRAGTQQLAVQGWNTIALTTPLTVSLGHYYWLMVTGESGMSLSYGMDDNGWGTCFVAPASDAQITTAHVAIWAGQFSSAAQALGEDVAIYATYAASTTPVMAQRLGRVFWKDDAGVVRERLIMQTNSTTIKTVAGNPRRYSDLSGPIVIGSYPLTGHGFVSTQAHLYVTAQDGLHDLDSTGYSPLLTPEVEKLASFVTNGQGSLAMGGYIYFGAGYGLIRVRVANQQTYADTDWCSPGQELPNETPIQGLPMAMVAYHHWLIFAQWDSNAGVGGTSYISWGRESGLGDNIEKQTPGPLTWNMSPIWLPGKKVVAMWVSGLINQSPRLWISSQDVNGTPYLSWAPLAMNTPYQDLIKGVGTYRFTNSFDAYLPGVDWGDDSMNKLMENVRIDSEEVGSGSQVVVHASMDRDQTWPTFGTATQSPSTQLVAGADYPGHRGQLWLQCTSFPDTPLIIRKVAMRALPRPDLREMRAYQLEVGSNVREAGGRSDDVGANQRKSRLEDLQGGDNASTSLGGRVLLRDEYGSTWWCYVIPPIEWKEFEQQGDLPPIITATITLGILSLNSSPSTDGTGYQYDAGIPYDSGRHWA